MFDYAKDGNAIKVVVNFKWVDSKIVSEELTQLKCGLRFLNHLIKFISEW
jgi:hypothetical protein